MIFSKEYHKKINPDNILSNYFNKESITKILFIVPTNRKKKDLYVEIIDKLPSNISKEINIETFNTITRKMLKRHIEFTEHTDSSIAVFLQKCSEEQKLKYFRNYRFGIPKGILDKIKNLIKEFSRNGIEPNNIIIEADENTIERAEEISKLYSCFLEKSNKLFIFDSGLINEKLLSIKKDSFNNIFRSIFNDINLIYIDGFDEFTIPEIMYIDKLSGVSEVQLFVNFDYYKFNKRIFGFLDETIEKLNLLGFNQITDEREENEYHLLSYLKANLFKDSDNNKKDFSSKIKIISAANIEAEIKLIAKEIKTLVHKERVSPYQICVVFNLIKNYSGIIRDVFSEYGIEFNLTDRKTLEKSKPVKSIITFLEILKNNFSIETILRSLTIGINLNSKHHEFDLYNLKFISEELNIVAGYKNWVSRIDSELNIFNNLTEIEKNNLLYRNKLEKALLDLEYIQELLKPFSYAQTCKSFIRNFRMLIEKLEIKPKLITDDSIYSAESISSIVKFINSVEESLLLTSNEFGENKKYSINFFIDEIKTVAAWERFNISEDFNKGVLVTSVDEIRGLKFDYLFLGGLYEGGFPSKFNPEIIFKGDFQAGLKGHQAEERYRFYKAISSVSNTLYLSYPKSDSKKEKLRSSFIDDLNLIVNTTELSAKFYENEIYSEAELLEETFNFGVKGSIEKYPALKDSILYNQSELHKLTQLFNNRFSKDELSSFNGNLFDKRAAEVFNRNFDPAYIRNYTLQLSESTFSVTKLENYSKCPFKFFSDSILNLEEKGETEDKIDSLTIGIILHRILYSFYSMLKRQNKDLKKTMKENSELMEKMIFEIADKIIADYYFNDSESKYQIEKIMGLAGNKKISILKKFLEAEEDPEIKETPAYFEVSFGKTLSGDKDVEINFTEPIIIGGVKLNGKIDRIDIDYENNTYSILDYKTGENKINANRIEEGIALQLPVYLIAAKEILQKKADLFLTPDSMSIFSLYFDNQKFGKKDINYKKIFTFEELREHIEKIISEIAVNIRDGKFGLTEQKNALTNVCKYCGFKGICRINEKNKFQSEY